MKISYSGPVVTRAEAKKLGLPRYFTGVPCRNGHAAQRYTIHRSCVECITNTANMRAKKHPEKLQAAGRAHYERNKEEILSAARADRIKNPGHRRTIERAYKQRNREQVRAGIKAWQKAHPERMKTKKRNRRAREIGASGKHTAADVANIRRMQNDRCAEPTCRVKLKGKGHVDHIIALARGGTNEPKNLQLLCPSCNSRKWAKDPIEFARELGRML